MSARYGRKGITSQKRDWAGTTALRAAKHAAAADAVKAAAMRSLRSAVTASAPRSRPSSSAAPSRVFSNARQELKSADYDIASGPTLGVISYGVGETDTQISALVAQGVQSNQRIGRRILIKSIQLKAVINNQADATINDVRLVLVVDKQANGTSVSYTDVFTSQTVEALPRLDNARRFSILWDKVYCLASNTSNPQADNVAKTIDFYKKVNIEQLYSGTGFTDADIRTGNLYLLAICDTAFSAVSLVQANWAGVLRIRYVDA